MKIAIFGATGRLGSALVEKALQDGHLVTAFVRNPLKFTMKHERLQIVLGDAIEPAAVERAVYSNDAVISAMAASGSKNVDGNRPLERGTRNIIEAMKKHGVTRLIVTAGQVVTRPEDEPDFRFKLLKAVVKLLAPSAYVDTVCSIDAVLASDADWTIVRMGRAAYASAIGVFAGFVNKKMGVRITRADAATFILNELAEKKYLRQAPAICSRRQSGASGF
jgi:nucleoside-diphosphate-sugar epimerase